MTDQLLKPIFENWLATNLQKSGSLSLLTGPIEKYTKCEFVGRAITHSDPVKMTTFYQFQLDNNLNSKQSICRDLTGRDFADVITEIADEVALQEKLGISDITNQMAKIITAEANAEATASTVAESTTAKQN